MSGAAAQASVARPKMARLNWKVNLRPYLSAMIPEPIVPISIPANVADTNVAFWPRSEKPADSNCPRTAPAT